MRSDPNYIKAFINAALLLALNIHRTKNRPKGRCTVLEFWPKGFGFRR